MRRALAADIQPTSRNLSCSLKKQNLFDPHAFIRLLEEVLLQVVIKRKNIAGFKDS